MTAGRLVAGRYRLTEQIGSGGMGVVWRAHDDRLDRIVAVKQLLVTPGLTPEETDNASRRALREGRIAARLHHPHAIAVYDVADMDHQPWLIMEYLASKSLGTILDERGTMDHEETARIGAQVASALAAAHAAGIVHRDVKPANILIGDDGNAKITDFGISRATGDVTVTATGMVAGTPAFLSPEVARGATPEPSSDVFSLGSTLYRMIEGRPPFSKGDNTLALLHAVAAGDVDPPTNTGPLTPVIMDMLRLEPQQRPTMVQAQRALAAIASRPQRPAPVPPRPTPPTAPIASSPPPQPAPLKPKPTTIAPTSRPTTVTTAIAAPRRRFGFAAVVVALLTAIGVLVAIFLSVDRPGSPGIGDTSNGTFPTVDSGATTATFEQMSQFVRSYYGLLPGDTDAAWAKLGKSYQSAAGGRASFDSFWSSISSVEVGSVSERDSSSVSVALTYSFPNGSASSETRWVQVGVDEGSLYIENSGL